MFVGHALLAFALVGGLAARYRSRREALVLGVLAGAFATVPDVDMSYALVGLVGADGGAVAVAGSFWSASTLVHRAVTHSLVVAPFVAAVAACWVRGRRDGVAWPLVLAGGLGLGLVVVAGAASGVLGAAVMSLFVAAACLVAEVGSREGVSPAATFAVALVGLASHPFGDLFTGHPPAMLYPLDASLVAHRVVLSIDPTLQLLGAFGVELAAIWAGVAVFARLTDRSLLGATDLRAGVGVGYAAAALVIPAPTLELSYPFVFSVLAVGTVGVTPRVRHPLLGRLSTVGRGGGSRGESGGDETRGESATSSSVGVYHPDAFRALATGLTAVTVAGAAYALAYLAVL